MILVETLPFSANLFLWSLIAFAVTCLVGWVGRDARGEQGCITVLLMLAGVCGVIGFAISGIQFLALNWEGEKEMYSALWAAVDLTPYAIFVLLSPAWFLMLFVTIGLAIWALEYENDWGLYSVLVAFFAISGVFGDFNILAAIWNYPLWCLGAIVGYLVAGAVWAIVKWVMYVDEKALEYEDYRREWLKRNGIDGTEVPAELKAKFTAALLGDGRWSYDTGVWKANEQGHGGSTVRKVRPYPVWHENKARATRWIVIWPLSILWSFLDDFLRAIVRKIIAYMSGIAEAIVRRRFKGWESNIEE